MHKQMERLYAAAEQLKGIKTQSGLARALNKSPQVVKNWESRGVSKEGMISAERVIGCSALWIEDGRGQMLSAAESGYIRLELLDVDSASGSGIAAKDLPEILTRVDVLESWVRSTIGVGGDLSSVKLITSHGISMQGSIQNGDILFVDSSVRNYDADGLYVISRDGRMQVKRLQKKHNGVLAILSDNKEFEPEHLDAKEAEAVQICGRVLAAWTVKRFW